jgi:hypothetical protein
MADINARIENMVRSFAAELQGLVGMAVREHIENALGSFSSGAAPKAAKPAAAAKATKATKAPKAPAAPKAPKATKSSRRKGAKRTAAEIANTISQLQAYIASKPGQRMEQIGVALTTATKDLTRPLQKLLDAGAVRREGAKRASKYFATGKSGVSATAKPRTGYKPTGRKPGRPKKS